AARGRPARVNGPDCCARSSLDPLRRPNHSPGRRTPDGGAARGPPFEERLMNRYRFSRCLWCLLLVVSAGGAWWGYSHSATGTFTSAAHDPAASDGLPGVVCFGHVDLVHGITALDS